MSSKSLRRNNGDFAWEFNDSVDDASSAVNAALMAKIKSYATQLVSVGGNSTDPTDPTESPNPTESPEPTPTSTPPAGQYVHNFTTDGTASDFFDIQGSLSTTKGTVVYNGLTLTQCLKIESSTRIEFTTAQASTLTLLFNSADGTKIKIDGTSYPMTNGIVSVPLAPGAHTLTKDNVANLFYMELAYA